MTLARSLANRATDIVSVRDHGAVGDGTADDTAAVVAALASGAKEIHFPDGIYKITAALTVPSNVRLVGESKYTTEIRKAFNGDLMAFGEGAQLEQLFLNGQGATFTGRGLVISGTAGRQVARSCKIVDFDGYCIEFTVTGAGSQSSWDDLLIYRYDGTGAGRYAIKIEDAEELSAKPRKFSNIETGGNRFLDVGGCNDLFIINSFVGEILLSDESRAFLCGATRVGVNETAMDIRGKGVAFAGCAFAPSITVKAGTVPVSISGCYFNGTVTDETTNFENLIEAPSVAWTPTWTGSVTNPAIGAGTLRAYYSRSGGTITVSYEMIAAADTTFGSGNWAFSIPRRSAGAPLHCGIGYARDDSASGAVTVCVAQLTAGSPGTIRLQATATALFTPTVPITWDTLDSLRFSITYPI
jgi:hypothetical protein